MKKRHLMEWTQIWRVGKALGVSSVRHNLQKAIADKRVKQIGYGLYELVTPVRRKKKRR